MTRPFPRSRVVRSRTILFATVTFLFQSSQLHADPPPGSWIQVFNDDFNGTSLDTSRWSKGLRYKEMHHDEIQAYRPENVTVANGICTFRAEKRTTQNMDMYGSVGSTMQYASGAIQTYDKWTRTYGYFEARIRMATGKGTWPAFWLVPDRGAPHDVYYRVAVGNTVNYPDRPSVACPMGNEIDVFEHMATWKNSATGSTRSNHGYFWRLPSDPAPALKYGSYGKLNDGCGPGYAYYDNPDTQFHTFAVYWGPGELIYYIDGVTVLRRIDPSTISVSPEHMILNLALSTNDWTGTAVPLADIDAGLPCTMDIDYVRVWSGTPSTKYYEAEHVSQVTSSDAVSVFSETEAGSGSAQKLSSNTVGDYVTYTLPVAQAGTYSIKLRYKRYSTRGRCQLSIDGVNHGLEQDQFYSSPTWVDAELGNKTFATSGNKQFRLAVTGKNPSSTGYDLTIDYLKLTPVTAATFTYEAESIVTATASDAVSIFSETGASAGSAEKLSSNAVNDYISYTLPVSQPGTYAISVAYKSYNTRGRYQLAIDGVNQGAVQDQFGTTAAWLEHGLGTKTFTTSGNKVFRFTVTGRSNGSFGYDMTFDYIRLQGQ